MNRTVEYEALLERVLDLRHKAIDAATLARAFDDYAEDLRRLNSKGSIADMALAELVKHALYRSKQARLLSATCIEQADEMERKGLS